MLDPTRIIHELNQAGVDFVVIGGVAATLHGCPEQTYDLDILYKDTSDNRTKLLHALSAIRAEWDRPLTDELLQRQPVFALNTAHGDLDIFTAVPGLATYSRVIAAATVHEWEGIRFKTLNLADLIAAKEAAADPNPRKQSALAFLKSLQAARLAK